MEGSLLSPEDVRPFPLRDSLGFLLVRTALKLRLLGNVLLQEAGEDITVDQWGILNLLWEADGQTPVELARRADKDKPIGRYPVPANAVLQVRDNTRIGVSDHSRIREITALPSMSGKPRSRITTSQASPAR